MVKKKRKPINQIKKHENRYIHIPKKALWIFAPLLIAMPIIYIIVAIFGLICKIFAIPIVGILSLMMASVGEKEGKEMAKEIWLPSKDMFELSFGWIEN